MLYSKHFSTPVISRCIHEVVCFLNVSWLQWGKWNIFCPFHWMHHSYLAYLKSYVFIYLSGNIYVEDLFLPCFYILPAEHLLSFITARKGFWPLSGIVETSLSFSLSESYSWAVWSLCSWACSFPSTALNTSPKCFYLVWNREDTSVWIWIYFEN